MQFLQVTGAPSGGQFYVDGVRLGEMPLFTGSFWFPRQIKAIWGGPASVGHKDHATEVISCDLRIILVSDGSGIANATGETTADKLDVLTKGLTGKLKEGMVIKGESVAVVSLRNRGSTSRGKVVADELADKVQGALIDTGWFDVKERIDLRGLLDEKDLETAGLVKNESVRKKLAGVKYIVIGGVTVTGPQKP